MHTRIDTESLAHFQDHASECIERLKETGTPLVLTVDGKAELIVQDAESYQELIRRAERADTVEALKEALQAVDDGRTRPASEAFTDFRRRHGIPG